MTHTMGVRVLGLKVHKQLLGVPVEKRPKVYITSTTVIGHQEMKARPSTRVIMEADSNRSPAVMLNFTKPISSCLNGYRFALALYLW